MNPLNAVLPHNKPSDRVSPCPHRRPRSLFRRVSRAYEIKDVKGIIIIAITSDHIIST